MRSYNHKNCSAEPPLFGTAAHMSTQPQNLLGFPTSHAPPNFDASLRAEIGATSSTSSTAPGGSGAPRRHVHAHESANEHDFASHPNLQSDSTSYTFTTSASSVPYPLARTDAYASQELQNSLPKDNKTDFMPQIPHFQHETLGHQPNKLYMKSLPRVLVPQAFPPTWHQQRSEPMGQPPEAVP